MDPNEALRIIRMYAPQLRAMVDSDDRDMIYLDLPILLDAVEAMDDWLKMGGFLPDEWAMNRPGELYNDLEDYPRPWA